MAFTKPTVEALPSPADSLPTQPLGTESQSASQDVLPLVDPLFASTPNWDDVWASLGPFPEIDMAMSNDILSSSCDISHSSTAMSLDEDVFPIEVNYSNVNDAFLNTDVPANRQHFPQSQDSSVDQTVDGPSLHSGSQCHCLTIALNHLKTLCPREFRTSAARSFEAEKPPPSIAQSLVADNERAVEAVDKILECPSSQDGYLLTIVFLVVVKVIDCYAAAGRALHIQHHNHSSYGRGGCATSKSVSADTAYAGGEENSLRVAVQIVLGELHHAQRLVNRLSKRFEEHKARGGAVDVEPGGTTRSGILVDGLKESYDDEGRKWPFSTLILYQLEEDLRRRLRTVSAGIADMIKEL